MSERTKIEWAHSSRINPVTGKPGPVPMPPRDGDKRQARQRINVEVRTGYRPHPNDLPCTDCGHTWSSSERRHEYDHYLGYGAENHMSVESVCTTCHARRSNVLPEACRHGHPWTPENLGRDSGNGSRFCWECRRARDRNRRDAKWWRAYRAAKKERLANG